MKSHIIVSAFFAVAIATMASAQSPHSSASPQAAKPQFQAPDMTGMWNQMMNAMYSPERASQLAHFQKLYYDALVKEGFTKDEALSIVRANQFPLSGGK